MVSVLDQDQAIKVIYGFFKDFQTWISQSKTVSIADLEHHLAKNFQITSNGQSKGKSAADYLTRLQKFQKKYSRFEMSQPIDEPLIHGNRVALYYRVDLTTKTGQHKQVQIMALGTIEDNKIKQWHQVDHEGTISEWDA